MTDPLKSLYPCKSRLSIEFSVMSLKSIGDYSFPVWQRSGQFQPFYVKSVLPSAAIADAANKERKKLRISKN